MRILGIDYGTVRIGVALSDSLLITASPACVIQRGGQGAVKAPIKKIKEIAAENGVERIVIGLPKKLDNSDGVMAEEARAFAGKLEKETRIPVVFWDERFSSAQAEKALLQGDVSRSKRKQKVDGVAAALILQSYLDSLCGARGGAL